MELHELIMSRHSIRDFDSKPVESNKIALILEAGRLAPSTQNRQCWRFVLLQDKENIKKFARHTGFMGTVNYFMASAPLIIVACADPRRSLKINEQDYYLVDTAISFHQMMLAAWSMGIGSCWLGAFNEKKVKEYLAVPDNIRVVGIAPFGYPKVKQSLYTKAVKTFAASSKRLAADKIFSYEKWEL